MKRPPKNTDRQTVRHILLAYQLVRELREKEEREKERREVKK